MSTLASLTVQLGIDTDRIAAGARRTVQQLNAIGRTTDRVVTDSNGRLRDVQGRFVSTSRSARQAATDIRSGWRGVIDVMGNVGRAVSQRVSGPIQAAGRAGLATGQGLAKSFAVMSAGAVGASAALSAVPLAIVGLGVMVAAQTKQVQDAFSGLKDHVVSTMKTLAQPLVKPVTEAAGQLRGVFDGIAPQLGKMFEAAAPMIKPLVAGIGNLVSGLVSGFVPVMQNAQPLVESLSVGLGTLGDALGGLFQGLSGGLGAAAGVFDGLFGVIGRLLPTIGDLLGLILQVAGPVLTKLLVGLGPVITQLGSALEPIIRALGPVLSALVDAVLALLQAVLPLLPPIAMLISALLPALTPILQALIPLFGALGEIIAALVPILVPIITLVAQLAGILANELAGFITSVVVPAVQAIAALLRGDFSGAMELAKTAVSNAAQFVLRIFTDLPLKIAAAFGPIVSILGGLAQKAGSKLVEWLQKKGTEAVNWVRGLPQRAANAMVGINTVLGNAGIALIRGFIDGIKSQFGSVRSVLGDLTSNLTSWKGPEPLDRRILTPNGRMVIGGFMRGIDQQLPSLRRQLGAVTSDLPGMVAEVNPFGVASASLRNDQRLTIDVSGSDEDMKRLIRRIVKNDGRGDVQTAFGQR